MKNKIIFNMNYTIKLIPILTLLFVFKIYMLLSATIIILLKEFGYFEIYSKAGIVNILSNIIMLNGWLMTIFLITLTIELIFNIVVYITQIRRNKKK